MAAGKEFNEFVAESRKLGLADVKALEAAWDQFASLVPESARGRDFREKLIKLLTAGVEYARFEEQVKGGDRG